MTTPFLLTESHDDGSEEAHERIEWLEIDGEGNERTRTGSVWAAGPPLAGQSTVWVLPDHPDDSEPLTGLLVALVTRWRPVGRRDPRNGRWYARTGRYVAKSTRLRESDPDGPHARLETARRVVPTHARPRDTPNRAEMDAYLKTLARLTDGA